MKHVVFQHDPTICVQFLRLVKNYSIKVQITSISCLRISGDEVRDCVYLSVCKISSFLKLNSILEAHSYCLAQR